MTRDKTDGCKAFYVNVFSIEKTLIKAFADTVLEAR